MKIVQVIPYFCFGGAETMCENLTYALKKLGHSVTVVCLLPERTPISERMERAGIRVRYLDKKLGLDLSMIQKLTKLFREEKPDVVHTHLNVLKYTAPAAKLAGVPRCVHTIHNVADKEAEGRASGIISGFVFRKGWSIPVALSPLVHQSVMDYYGLKAEQIPTVFNGVPLNRCIPRETYVLGEKAVLVHVGRFNVQKNHSGLLEAFRLLQQQISNAELWLLGDGELREQMEEYALRLGIRDRVRFLGSQENVYPYLHDADVFVLPSRYEGMPMTVIEAMGTGLPIVASNVGGIPDMVEDGESGLLTTGAPEDVARCCAALLSDENLRQRLGRRARAESERFSAEEMARSYCRVYES